MAYPILMILWQIGKTPFCCPAPKRLLTKEPLVAPKELTITKKEGGNAAGYVGNGQFHLS